MRRCIGAGFEVKVAYVSVLTSHLLDAKTMEMMGFEPITHTPRGRLLFRFELHPQVVVKVCIASFIAVSSLLPIIAVDSLLSSIGSC